MACSTCDGYEFMPGGDGNLVDCPDCRAPRLAAALEGKPSVARPGGLCPVHRVTVDVQARCPVCLREAAAGIAQLNSRYLVDRAREIALEAGAAA